MVFESELLFKFNDCRFCNDVNSGEICFENRLLFMFMWYKFVIMWSVGIFLESEFVFKFKFFMFISFLSCGGMVLMNELEFRLRCLSVMRLLICVGMEFENEFCFRMSVVMF